METISNRPAVEGPFPVTQAEMQRARFGVGQYRTLISETSGDTREYLLHGPSSTEIQAVFLGVKPAAILEEEGYSYSDLVYFGIDINQTRIDRRFTTTLVYPETMFYDSAQVEEVYDSNPDIFTGVQKFDFGEALAGHLCGVDPKIELKLGLVLGYPREAAETFQAQIDALDRLADTLGFPSRKLLSPKAILDYFRFISNYNSGDVLQMNQWRDENKDLIDAVLNRHTPDLDEAGKTAIRDRRFAEHPGYAYSVIGPHNLNTPQTRKVEYVFAASGMNSLLEKIHSSL